MPYNQITSNLTIEPGPDPTGPNKSRIISIINDALVNDGYLVNWLDYQHQPYHLYIDNGTSQIDLYIYAWRITNGGRTNLPNEKRIEINAVNAIGFKRKITTTQKTLLLGIYDAPSTPVFAAWNASDPSNITTSVKSRQVNVEDLLCGILNEMHQCCDSQGNIIYTFSPSFLGDYIDLVRADNQLNIPPSPTPEHLSRRARRVSTQQRNARSLRAASTTESILNSINNLTSTEKDIIAKQRIGQNLFKKLLLNQYQHKCAFCNISTDSMLIASHIKKWSDCSNNHERLDVNNGLLLCAHHDALFDKHLISFDSNGNLAVSPTLSQIDILNLGINNIPPNISMVSGINLANMFPYLCDHYSKLLR